MAIMYICRMMVPHMGIICTSRCAKSMILLECMHLHTYVHAATLTELHLKYERVHIYRHVCTYMYISCMGNSPLHLPSPNSFKLCILC